tara:strand:- start:394 stop:1275 length:882 start_codon:yes stop_codon:yes gene_type:complete
MKRIDVERKPIDKKDYIRRTAHLSDVSRHITEDVIIYHQDKPILLYRILPKKPTDVRWAVKNIKYGTGKRTHGLVNTSAVFGYNPRQENKRDFCSASAMGTTHPKQHYVISRYAKEVAKFYHEFFPRVYNDHKNKVKEKVKKQWVINGSVFTSGIVNKNNQLKYHYDSGNFKSVFSNMIVFKGDVDGGHLVIPELDISLEVADNSLTIFDGQDLLHGVSPIEYIHEKSYRYSIVYYSLERMWQCMTVDEEIARIRSKKMQREINRIDPDHLDSLRQRKKEAKNYKESIENENK